ncbi:FAD-dependent oxidoreductase [Streptomyces sp. tea 10]|nr:FAD-dependent oxidoreductase [Streptomyces sp. tea 10]
MRSFDLIIVGSGSGNSILTDEYADLDVAIVEPGRFGGTCLNVGCIPTKMYAYPATVGDQARDAIRLGLDAVIEGVDWPGMRDRIFARIDAISKNGLQYRESLDNVTVIQEYVHFVEPKVLETESGQRITADEIVLANGSRVSIPDVLGTDLPGVHTSDTVMRLDEFPRDVIVVGGGYVAAEFCHVFRGLGASVTQLNRSQRLLRASKIRKMSTPVSAASATNALVTSTGYGVYPTVLRPRSSIWMGMFGIASRSSRSRSHGSSPRKRSATSYVAPPQASTESSPGSRCAYAGAAASRSRVRTRVASRDWWASRNVVDVTASGS